MDLFKNIKDKVNERFFASDDEEYADDEVDTAEDEEETRGEALFQDDITPPAYNGYSYSPTAGMNPPEYNFGKTASASSAVPPVHDFTSAKTAEKKGGNIYSMNNARPVNKFKLNSILLRDIYDAKNVAALMVERDTIIVVNLSSLPDDQKMRAMDFLDGAKFVTKSVFARLSDNICVFVPENVELYGDFHSQVDIDSIR